ncbi:peptidylprolyl isomerase [Viridibacterium curvum]|uniref:Chaperone SurA n=2 Tax=Viridibacterium curvum TaxID=1101404 RepID=A0ABP9R7E5_9RHOO
MAVPFALQAAEPLDRIAAIANDEIITMSEVRAKVDQTQRQLPPDAPKMSRAQMEEKVLDRLILERLLLQRARSSGLRVDDVTLDRAVQRIAEQNKLPMAKFREVIEKQEGVPWQRFREDIRTEILISRLREREVDSRIVVSDAEIDAALASPEAQASGKEYQIAHIFIRAPEGANAESWMRLSSRASEVQRLLRQGDDFGKLAAAFSDAPDGMQGGVMAWQTVQRMPTVYAEEVVRLKPGQISNVLRSPAGLHVIKLVAVNDAASAKPLNVTQTQTRHILLRASEVLNDDDARRRLGDLRKRILAGARFEDIARTTPGDASAARGGDLGWLSPGDTVPEFERAMNALKPGEISEPIQSPFGWHLIQVMARRDVDMSGERRRLEMRQSLRERKSDEAYEAWLRQVRDEAFVDVRRSEP